MHRNAQGWLLLAALLTACSAPGGQAPERPGDAVVVGSFDFAESELLGEIYAQALTEAGLPVRRELRLGPRELVLPALQQGQVDVVPEYLGTALAALMPEASAGDTATTRRRLQEALRSEGLRVLEPSSAQNQNGLAVLRSTAERLRLRTISDLAAAEAALTLTGPPECPTRPYCLPGLRSAYGLEFEDFVPYKSESQRTTALEQGIVDVAVVFTTDGALAGGDVTLLEDDLGLQPVENVVPVVTERAVERHGPSLVTTLDRVSAALDSEALTFLNWRVEVTGNDLVAEARGWLQRHDLVPR